MKYIEIGIGNSSLIRTETELEDGTEFEQKGIKGPINFYSCYIRIWLSKTVLIADFREGFKRQKKNRSEFKLIFGIVSS